MISLKYFLVTRLTKDNSDLEGSILKIDGFEESKRFYFGI